MRPIVVVLLAFLALANAHNGIEHGTGANDEEELPFCVVRADCRAPEAEGCAAATALPLLDRSLSLAASSAQGSMSQATAASPSSTTLP
jgi:hypothetical protein